MTQREVTVASAVGLHARPAAAFVKAAGEAAAATGASITVGRVGGPPADASSIVSVMSLGAKHGETLVLEADGDGDAVDQALDRLVALVAEKDA